MTDSQEVDRLAQVVRLLAVAAELLAEVPGCEPVAADLWATHSDIAALLSNG